MSESRIVRVPNQTCWNQGLNLAWRHVILKTIENLLKPIKQVPVQQQQQQQQQQQKHK